MSYLDLFQRYGSPPNEGRVEIRGYLLKPGTLEKPENVAHYDEYAARLIEEAEEAIECLRDYRQALAARYAQLETMPYHLRLELERYPRDHYITYYVRMFKVYEDGTEAQTLHETYPGKQRRDALARFEELKKKHPGIETIKDIERRSWER